MMKTLFRAFLLLLALAPPAWAELNDFKDHTFHSAATATGDGTDLVVDKFSAVAFTVTISGTAEVTFQVTQDGSTFTDRTCVITSSTSGTLSTTASATGTYQCNIAGMQKFRVSISICSSCTVTVTGRATTAIFGGGGGGAEADTPATIFARGDTFEPTSEAAPLKIRGTGGQSTSGWNIYQHSDGTPIIKCVIANVEGACNVSVDLNAAKSFIIKDAGAAVLTITPDNAGNLKYVWAAGYRPIKTLSLPADALYPRGSSTLVTGTALITSGLISPYITTTDSDNDGFYRYLVMDPKWDGGTITATVTVVNTNATPANNFEVDISGECYPAGTAVATTILATGEQAANVEFDAAGACGGSACSQFDPASATTAAITINGTPAGGNFCAFQGQVDATATTETVTGIKIVQLDIHYGISQGF